MRSVPAVPRRLTDVPPSPTDMPRRVTMATVLAVCLLGRHARAQDQASAPDPWAALSTQIFDHQPVGDGSLVLALEAPYRAEDAAVVPLSLRSLLPKGDPRRIRGVTLVIDENPSPLAAAFSFSEGSPLQTLSTRIRVDSYTNIHAVARMADGALLATTRFVKAAGGCSAPAAKQGTDTIPLGTMRLRQFTADAQQRHELQLMIRHPNYSGMQMDQLTRLYVPAHFVSAVRIWQGEDLLLAVDSGISIAENPEFRFDYQPNGADLRAEVQDSQGQRFKQSWPATRA